MKENPTLGQEFGKLGDSLRNYYVKSGESKFVQTMAMVGLLGGALYATHWGFDAANNWYFNQTNHMTNGLTEFAQNASTFTQNVGTVAGGFGGGIFLAAEGVVPLGIAGVGTLRILGGALKNRKS